MVDVVKDERHERSGFLAPEGSEHVIAAAQPVSRDGLTIDPQRSTFEHVRHVPGWRVGGVFRLDDRGLTIVSLAITPADQETVQLGVSSDLLRLIKLPELSLQLVALLTEVDQHLRAGYESWTGKDAGWDQPRRSPIGRPRRVDDPDASRELRKVAIVYLTELKNGSGVRVRVAKRIGRSDSDVAALVRAARTDGWLTAAKHGSASAAPGPRLRADPEFPECLTSGEKRSTKRK